MNEIVYDDAPEIVEVKFEKCYAFRELDGLGRPRPAWIAKITTKTVFNPSLRLPAAFGAEMTAIFHVCGGDGSSDGGGMAEWAVYDQLPAGWVCRTGFYHKRQEALAAHWETYNRERHDRTIRQEVERGEEARRQEREHAAWVADQRVKAHAHELLGLLKKAFDWCEDAGGDGTPSVLWSEPARILIAKIEGKNGHEEQATEEVEEANGDGEPVEEEPS